MAQMLNKIAQDMSVAVVLINHVTTRIDRGEKIKDER
jgi:hypothetical protein